MTSDSGSAVTPMDGLRRRSPGTMIFTAGLLHAAVIAASVVYLLHGPGVTDDPGCEWFCSRQDKVWFFLFFIATPVGGLSWVLTVVIIVAITRRTLSTALAQGQSLAPPNYARDALTGVGLALTGLLGAVAAITAYSTVRRIGS